MVLIRNKVNIRFGHSQGYKNIEEDLNELNYVSAITETFNQLSCFNNNGTLTQYDDDPLGRRIAKP